MQLNRPEINDKVGHGRDRYNKEEHLHHVPFHKIKTQWDFLDTFLEAVNTLGGIRQNDIRPLIEPSQRPLLRLTQRRQDGRGD